MKHLPLVLKLSMKHLPLVLVILMFIEVRKGNDDSLMYSTWLITTYLMLGLGVVEFVDPPSGSVIAMEF